ncbi:hypothetical protein MrNuV_ORF042 [Macrobrachium rosenbergii nudivirus]|nr:hypothetical protein MrNuV_ORF042 [Macrobrachium rosenbergii nudivirus]
MLSTSEAIKRAKELLQEELFEKPLLNKLARQFTYCKIHLLIRAEVITHILHKPKKSNNNQEVQNPYTIEDDEDDNLLSIQKESKTTRRNAHYKSTVLVILYYLTYYAYHGKPPRNIGYTNIITNDRVEHYFNRHPEERAILCSDRLLEKYKKIKNKAKFNKILIVKNKGLEYKPIQSHTQPNQYTYTYNLITVMDGIMPDIIEFAYKNFNKYCREYILINLAIKYKIKEELIKMKNEQKKPIYTKKRAISDDEDDDDEEANDKNSLENEEHEEMIISFLKDENKTENEKDLAKYLPFTVSELKMKLKEPSVLMKFCQALLFECDWIILFSFLKKQLEEGFCYGTMMKLLIYLIWNVTKVVCPPHEREAQNKNLDRLLKNLKYDKVVHQLQIWTYNYKYSIYPLTFQDSDCDITVQEMKNFNELARNTQTIHYTLIKSPMVLKIEDVNFQSINKKVKLIMCTVDGSNETVFDMIELSINKNQCDLSQCSWKDRLDKFKSIMHEAKKKYKFVLLNEGNHRLIQFDKLPCGSQVCKYVRTTGLGFGTLFFKGYLKFRGLNANMPNKRFKKTTLSDLNKIQISHTIEFDPKTVNQPITQAPSLSDNLTPPNELMNLVASQFLNILQNQQQQALLSPQYIKEEDPYLSPIPSPNYNHSEEYLGGVYKKSNTEFKFEPYDHSLDL